MKDLIKVFILITLILMIAGIISAIYFNEPVVLIVFGFFLVHISNNYLCFSGGLIMVKI